jgi:exodeoxyribonuclease VII large subunit
VNHLAESMQRLKSVGRSMVEQLSNRLRLAERALNSVSPLATLERGYAIVTDTDNGRILTDASKTKPGKSITARLAHGSLSATVDNVGKATSSND